MATPSAEKPVASRVLPRLSFKALMGIVTGAVFMAWLIRHAYTGHPLAIAVLFPVIALAVFYALSVLLFLIAWIPAVVLGGKYDERREGNPFAADQLPPQILPPKGF